MYIPVTAYTVTYLSFMWYICRICMCFVGTYSFVLPLFPKLQQIK